MLALPTTTVEAPKSAELGEWSLLSFCISAVFFRKCDHSILLRSSFSALMDSSQVPEATILLPLAFLGQPNACYAGTSMYNFRTVLRIGKLTRRTDDESVTRALRDKSVKNTDQSPGCLKGQVQNRRTHHLKLPLFTAAKSVE